MRRIRALFARMAGFTTFGIVAGVMAAIGITACWVPALRASRIDPVIAMRST